MENIFFNLNLEEDELDVLEYCVDTVLTKWEKDFEQDCKDAEMQKNPFASETLGYTKEWIEKMHSIIDKIQPLKNLQTKSDEKENKKFREMMDDLFMISDYLDE